MSRVRLRKGVYDSSFLSLIKDYMIVHGAIGAVYILDRE